MPADPDKFPGARRRNGVWELTFSLGPDPAFTGRKRYRQQSVSFRGTKTEAKAERQRLMATVRPHTVDRTDATFRDLYEAWMAGATDIGEGTRYTYDISANKYLLPAFGDVKLRELTTQRIEQLYAHLHRPKPAGAGLSPRTIRRVHAIVQTALRRAQAWEWLDRNPAEFARPPKVHGRPTTYTPTIVELQRALIAAADIGGWALPFVWTAAATGMRRGELCGLRWDDIDGVGQVIHVRRNVVDVGGYPIEKLPKTGEGRIVEIPVELVAVLAAYQDVAGPSPWLWPTDAEERVVPDKLTDVWNEVKAAANIPKTCRLHDLRHAYGTNLLEHGGEGIVAAVAAQLGHGDMATTMKHYLGSRTTGRQSAAATMGRLLAGTGEP